MAINAKHLNIGKNSKALLLALLWLFSIFGAAEQDEPDYAVVGAALFDGTGKPPIHDSVMLISQGKIVAVGRRGEVSIPPNERIIDASGKWVVPGLIDAHVHFAQSAGLYTRPDIIDLRNQRPYKEEMAWIKERLPYTMSRYICSGITSVVDFGGPMWTLALKDRFKESKNAPRISAAGPLLSTYIPPELNIDDPPIIALGDPQNAQRQVENILKKGADLIKIWFLERGHTPATKKSILAVIKTAHNHGTRVVVHATELDKARLAVQAGADILAHSVFDKLIDDDLIKLLKEKRIIYIPTLQVRPGYDDVLSGDFSISGIEQTCGDQEVIATWDENENPQNSMREDNRIAAINLRNLVKAGVTIAAGSDAGNIGTLHGAGLHKELWLMVQAGLSPEQVLIAATKNAALATDKQAQVGTLEAGKMADFIILDADPLKDIRNLTKIVMVSKGGSIGYQKKK